MAERWREPFSRTEMDEIRRLTRDEEGLAARFFALLARVGRSLPFAEEAVAVFYCAMDPATSLRAKGILLAAIAYLVLPVDAIPDFVPLLGFTDDAAVIAAAVAAVRGEITEDHRARARQKLGSAA